MATHTAPSTLPISMQVAMLGKQFPFLADELDMILEEPGITDEQAEIKIRNAVELYHMRLKAGLITSTQKH